MNTKTYQKLDGSSITENVIRCDYRDACIKVCFEGYVIDVCEYYGVRINNKGGVNDVCKRRE